MTRSDPERAGALRVAAGRHWWLPVVLAALVVVGSLGSVTSLAVHPSAGAVTGHVDARAQNATRAAQAFADSRVELLEQLVVPYAERPEVQAAVTAGELQRGPTPVTTTLHQVQTSAPGLVAAWVSDERGTMLATDSGTSEWIGEAFSYRLVPRGAQQRRAAPSDRSAEPGVTRRCQPDRVLSPRAGGPVWTQSLRS